MYQWFIVIILCVKYRNYMLFYINDINRGTIIFSRVQEVNWNIISFNKDIGLTT